MRELELSAAEKYVVPGDEKDSAAAIQKNKEGIANANLALARDRARLLDAELEVSSQLADALAVMGTKQRLVEANFNSQAAAQRNMAVVQVAHDLNRETISFDVLLQAQRSVADAHGTYLRSQPITPRPFRDSTSARERCWTIAASSLPNAETSIQRLPPGLKAQRATFRPVTTKHPVREGL